MKPSFELLLLALLTFGVTSAAHAQDYDDSDTHWCNRVVHDLRAAQDAAKDDEAYGDFDRASDRMESTVSRLASDPDLVHGLIITRALSRGVRLADTLKEALNGAPNGPRTLDYFLEHYVSFAIDLAENTDEDFEQKWVDYVRTELQLVLDNMTTSGGDSGYAVVPVGNSNAFLRLMSMSARYASKDLRESAFARHYSCAIRYLSDLADTIDGGGYGPVQATVNKTYHDAKEILDSLSPDCECSRSRE